MKTIEELARECIAEDWDDHIPGYYRDMNIARFAALVRAEALEEAAKVCDMTPPYPFRPSLEAAHAIRALKDKP